MALANTLEIELSNRVTAVVEMAEHATVFNDDSYQEAAEFAKTVKATQKAVEAYWEPLRDSTYKAYKGVSENKKNMLDPLKKAETILKRKMGDYQMELKRKREAEEAELREAARRELDQKLIEAAMAEESGDAIGADMAMAEAEVMDNLVECGRILPEQKGTVAKGISHTKAWEIVSIDPDKVPVKINGTTIRPVDEKAIMKVLKASDGNIDIPGVEFRETIAISVRAS